MKRFSYLKSTLLRSALVRLPVLGDRDLFETFQPEIIMIKQWRNKSEKKNNRANKPFEAQ